MVSYADYINLTKNNYNFTNSSALPSAYIEQNFDDDSYTIHYSFVLNQADLIATGNYDTNTLGQDLDSNPLKASIEYAKFSQISNSVQQAVQLITHNAGDNSGYAVFFSDVSNISFEASAPSSADIIFGAYNYVDPQGQPVDTRLANTHIYHDPAGVAEQEDNQSYSTQYEEGVYGDVWINANTHYNWNSVNAGGVLFQTVLHEIEHALGLKHPYGTNMNEGKYSNLYAITDDNLIPGMQYIDTHYETLPGPLGLPVVTSVTGISLNSVFSSGLQLFDIVAIQEIYGRNYDMRSANTEYKPGQGLSSNPFIYTIWDGGGHDTINVSGYDIKAFIDLRQGEFSSIGHAAQASFDADGAGTVYEIGQAKDNVAIAFHTVIEDAIGTGYNDIIIGNDWQNDLAGGDGNDVIYGDGFTRDGTVEFDDIDDSVIDPDQLDPNRTKPVNDKDALSGGAGDDRLYGGFGDDELTGGRGLDYVAGGSGDDHYSYWFNSESTNYIVARHIISDGYDVIDETSQANGLGFDSLTISGATINDLKFAVLGTDLVIFRDKYIDTNSGYIDYHDAGGIFILNGSNGSPLETITIAGLTISRAYFDQSNPAFLSPADALYDPADPRNLHFVTLTLDQKNYFENLRDSIVSTSAMDTASDADDFANIEPGSGNDDTILGSSGKDTVNASGGDDVVFAGIGSDTVDGGSGSDTIYGEDGKDNLSGGSDDDVIYGGSDDDIISGGDGHDELYGGTGADTLYAVNASSQSDSAGNSLYGEGGNDKLYGSNSNDALYGGDGNDIINAYGGADYIETGEGNNTIYAGGGDDNIRAYGYNVSIASGNNLIYGEAGNDSIIGGNGQDTIYGGDGNDNINAFDGNDVVYGDAGNDTINGAAGSDTVYGGDDDDSLNGGDGDDTIDGGDGADSIIGGNGNDSIWGGAGNDIIYGDNTVAYNSVDDNAIYGGDGNDQIYDFGGSGHLEGNAGDDIIVGGFGTYIDGGTGNDTLTFGSGIIYGGAGNDQITSGDYGVGELHEIHGGDDNDTIKGGVYDDIIYGDAGNDTITLSQGKDILFGGNGDDLFNYSMATSGSADSYYVSGTTLNNLETGSSVDISGMAAIHDIVDGGSGEDTLLINSSSFVLRLDALDLPLNGVNEQRLIDIEKIDLWNADRGVVDLTSSRFLLGNIQIIGSVAGDVIWSSSGNDTIYGNAGDDFLFGGAGDDYINGGDGTDTIYGGAGNDSILVGGVQTGSATKYADGGLGDDSYFLDLGSLNHTSGFGGTVTLADSGGEDTLYINAVGGTTNVISIQHYNVDDMYMNVYGVSIIIKDYFSGSSDKKIEHVVIQGRTPEDIVLDLTANQILSANAIETVNGTTGNDLLVSNNYLSTPDTLYGNGGDDQILGGWANDLLYGQAGNDLIMGGDGNDTLIGGAGDDTLYGSAGSDTYIYSAGDGNDIIWNSDDHVGGGSDTLQLSGISIGQANFTQIGNDLQLAFTNISGSVTIINGMLSAERMTNFVFSDASVSGASFIIANGTGVTSGTSGNDIIWGSVGNDSINGNGGADTIYAGGGNDIIHGDDGADTIYAGSGNTTVYGDLGNDYIYGGTGDNIYFYRVGDGIDNLQDTGGNDAIMVLSNTATPLISSNISVDFANGTEPGTGGIGHYIVQVNAINAINISNEMISASRIEKLYINNDYSNYYDLATRVWHSSAPPNTAPIAKEDNFTINEDSSATGNLFVNNAYMFGNGHGPDTDADGDALIATAGSFTTSNGGVVNIYANGDFSYAPTANYNGTDSFTYEISDGHGGTATGTVNVEINPVNDISIGMQDDFVINKNSTVSGNVLADNGHGVDFDVDGDTLTISEGLISTPNGGSGFISANGDFTFTPGLNFVGTDSFRYQLRDGHGSTTFTKVNILVENPNYAPIAYNDDFTIDANASISGNLLADNGNGADTDSNGDTLVITASSFTTVHGGSVTIAENGDFSYTPLANYTGVDNFTYEVSDGHGGTASATVNMLINALNVAPVAKDDTFLGTEDVVLNGNVLVDNGYGSDTDNDNDTLTVQAANITTAHGGNVILLSNGDFSYAPATNYNGADNFTYQVDDGHGHSSAGTVNITLSPVNDAPIAQADDFNGVSATAVTGNVLSNNGHGLDTDIDGDVLSVLASNFVTSLGGTVSLSANGNFTYTSLASFTGTDGFDYTLSDGHGGTTTGHATVVIAPPAGTIVGTPGNDVLTGTTAADVMYGLDGDDNINGNSGNDKIYAGSGNDIVNGFSGDDYLDGGSGIDTLSYGGASSPVNVSLTLTTPQYTTGSGTDTVMNFENLTGSSLDDILEGDSGNNILDGGAGSDTLSYSHASASVSIDLGLTVQNTIGAGVDTTLNFENARGSLFNDYIQGNSGNNVLAGGGGVDTISYSKASSGVTVNILVNTAQNTIGAGTDTLSGFANIVGSNYNDTLTGTNSSNVIEGGAGDDILNGAAGIDTASYLSATSAVAVNLSITSAQNTGGAGIDTLTGFENIIGSTYDDVLTGDSGANIIQGGVGGDDILDGGTGVDTVSYIDALAGVVVDITKASAQNTVGAGNDLLLGFENVTGSNFNDILTGDSGNNIIAGGLGNDTVKYDLSTAGVTINLATTTAQNTIGAGTDTLTGIENIVGSVYNDTLTGDANNNIITAGDGNDAVVGGLGNDVLDGGAGVDSLSYAAATAGVTVSLATTSAQNTGVTGIDTISNFENLTGSAYNDVLTANASDNIIDGGAGVDTIVYSNAISGITLNLGITTAQSTGGSGADTVLNFENIIGSDYDDVLTGSNSSNVINGGAGNDVINGILGNSTANVDTLDGGTGIDTLVFSGSSYLTVDLSRVDAQSVNGISVIIQNFENLTTSTGNDIVMGNSGDNVLDGGAGIDTLSYKNSTAGIQMNMALTNAQNTVASGYDTVLNFENITGSNYDDVLTGDSGNNTIIGGLGNDVLDGGAGTDIVSYLTATSGVTVNLGITTAQNTFSAGIDTLSNFEKLYGSSYNDVLTGGSGDDYIVGQGGQDIIDGGAGNDTLSGQGTVSYASATSGVTVSLATTTAQNTIGAGVDTIGGFDNLTGSSFNDTLGGKNGNNIIHGGDGDDSFMFGFDGFGYTDTLYGDNGSDYLNLTGISNNGANVNLSTNTAQVIIPSWTNLILYSIENVLGTSSNDTVIGSQDNNYFNGMGGFDTFSYVSATAGVTVDLAIQVAQNTGAGMDMLYQVEKIIGSSFNDVLKGAVFSNGSSIDAGAGDDIVYASYTNVIADGGLGNDTVDLSRVESAASSAYIFDLSSTVYQNWYGTVINFENVIGGQSNNVISGTAGNNIMDGGAGINTVSYLSSGSAVTVNLGITIAQNTFGAGVDTLRNFQAIIGSNFDDTLIGGSGNDTLTGGLGDDTLDGADGSDTLSYASATSAITFNLALTTAQNTGGAGIDTVINFENLLGSGYNDTLIGDAGNNTINGGAGNDLISGGDGNDILSGGGSGFDTVSYASAGAGVSIDLTVTSAQNTIGAGIDTLSGFKALVGSSYGDSIIAGTTATNPNTTNFTIDAGSGDDFVYVGRGVAILNGGAGSDTLVFSGSQFSYDGTTFNLSILTSQTNGPGQITAQNFENLIGSDAADNLTGDANNNIIEGGLGNDVLDGGDGIDTLSYAHAISNLTIDLEVTTTQGVGAMGNDTVRNFENYLGSAYSDYLYISAGTRTLVGGGGTDTLNYSHSTAGINADLFINAVQGAAGAWVHTVSEFENVIGTSYNDIISGNAGNNLLNGGVGNNTVSYENALAGVTVSLATIAQQNTIGAGLDTLYNFQNIIGSGHNDTLTGDTANNIINGGGGSNTLTGGAGADIFAFDANVGINTITDFNLSQNDKLDLSHILEAYDSVTQAITDFVQITESAGSSALFVDKDGAGTVYGFSQVANVTGVTGLTDVEHLTSVGTLIV